MEFERWRVWKGATDLAEFLLTPEEQELFQDVDNSDTPEAQKVLRKYGRIYFSFRVLGHDGEYLEVIKPPTENY